MQLRPVALSSSSRAPDDNHIPDDEEITPMNTIHPQQQQHEEADDTARRREWAIGHHAIDLHHFSSFTHRRSPPISPWYRSSDRFIHLVPLIVLLCWIILWWFSHPVNVVIKDGQLIEVNEALSLPDANKNKTHVELAILASVTPAANASVPASVPEEVFTVDNNAQPTSANG